MLKSGLVRHIGAQNRHLTRPDVEKIVDAMLGEIIAGMVRGDRVELRGFGVFSIRHHAPRIGRNPRSGAKVTVDNKFVPHFKPGREMRRRLNRPEG